MPDAATHRGRSVVEREGRGQSWRQMKALRRAMQTGACMGRGTLGAEAGHAGHVTDRGAMIPQRRGFFPKAERGVYAPVRGAPF